MHPFLDRVLPNSRPISLPLLTGGNRSRQALPNGTVLPKDISPLPAHLREPTLHPPVHRQVCPCPILMTGGHRQVCPCLILVTDALLLPLTHISDAPRLLLASQYPCLSLTMP